MGKTSDLIKLQELKSTMIDGAFGITPHNFYVVYDDLMDEFFIKITQPETVVSSFYITDKFALLVEPKTKEVIGFQLGEFSKEFLPHFNRLNKLWEKKNLKDQLGEYQTVPYEPSKKKKDRRKNESWFFKFEPDVMDEALALA